MVIINQERQKDMKTKMDDAGWWDYAWFGFAGLSCCRQSASAICQGGKIHFGPTQTHRDMGGGGRRQCPTQNRLLQRAAWPSPARWPPPAPPPSPHRCQDKEAPCVTKAAFVWFLTASPATRRPPNGCFCCTGWETSLEGAVLKAMYF